MVEKRFDLGLEICKVDGIYLCRQLQGDTGSPFLPHVPNAIAVAGVELIAENCVGAGVT